MIFKSALFKNMSSLVLIQIANFVIPLLIVPYISRIIGLENYGKLEYARTFVLYFTILIDYGFNLTATRSISIERNNRERVNEIISNIFVAKFFLFLIATLIFWLLLYFDNTLNEKSSLLWVTYLINFGFLLFPLWFFQGMEKLATIAYINFAIKLIIVSGVIFFIHESSDYWLYNLFLSISQILIGFVAVYILYSKFKYRFNFPRFQNIVDQFKNGFNVFITTILVSFFVSYAFILLQKFGTDAEVGAYSTANKLVMTVQVLILLPFSQAFFPFIAKTAKEDLHLFINHIKKASIAVAIITSVIGLITFIFAELIIKIIFGEDFLFATQTLRILAFLPVFTILNNLFSYQGLLSLNQDRLFLWIHVFFTVTIVAGSYFLIPIYGLEGVAYIRIISEILLMSVSLFYLIISVKKKVHAS